MPIPSRGKSELIRPIVSPFDRSPEQTMDSLNSKHELRILAHLSGTGFQYWQSASIYDLENVMDKFPTPYELAETEQEFLNSIRDHNSPQKYSEYEQAMADFKHKIYGKRLEYYNALEDLQTKADQQNEIQNARTEVLNSYSDTVPLRRKTTPARPIKLHRSQIDWQKPNQKLQ